ncbi:MAG: HAD family hydrolase [Planctomycetes bacterium]|nr:HAD family hydrolase [Planctomycetota bacterium]
MSRAADGSLPPLRGVLFDVDGTLYSMRPMRALVLADLALHLPREGFAAARRTLRVLRTFRRVHEDLRAGLDRDGAPLDAFHHAEAARRAGVAVAEVERAVGLWMRQRVLGPIRRARRPGLVPLLRRLRAQGARIGVLSDYPAARKVDALGIGDLVDAVVAATDAEVDALKPDPRGFLVAAARLGLPPAAICYVGDRPDVDAAGAAGAGMPAVLIGSRAVPGVPVVRSLAALGRLLEPALIAGGGESAPAP